MPHARRKGAIYLRPSTPSSGTVPPYMYIHPSAPLTALRRAYSVDEVSPARALGNGPDTVTVTGERKVDAN
jgi:hypothetical protein